MINRAIPPLIHPIESFSLPKPRCETLSNGVPVFYFDNPYSELVYVLLQVHTGSLFQPAKHVCNFAYTLLRESSPFLSPEETAERLDFNGANVSVNVGLEWVQVVISAPRRNLSSIMPVIADFLVNPIYRADNLRIMQDKEVKNLAYNSQKTDFVSWQLMWNTLFADVFPGVAELSTSDTINSLEISQLQEFYKRSFCAENISVFVTGNIGDGDERVISEAFSPIPGGIPSPSLPQVPSQPAGSDIVYRPMAGCLQSSVILCQVSEGYNHPDRTAFSVLNTLTGGYFSSRLMQNLRERQGLTYGVSSSSTYFGNQSVFAISSDVNAAQTAHAIDSAFEELQRLQDEVVGDEELNMVKNYMAGIQLRSVDTSVSTMQKYAFFHRFGLDESEMYRYLSSVRETTSEDILNLAKKYFTNNKFTRIVVGDYLAEK